MSQREPKSRFEWMTSQEAVELGIPLSKLMNFSHGGHGDSHVFALDFRYCRRLKRRARIERSLVHPDLRDLRLLGRIQREWLQVLTYAAPTA